MLSPNACCRVRSAWCVGCDFRRPHGCCSSAMLTNIAANTMAPVMRVRSRTHLCFATMACPNLECMCRNTLSSVHVRCARCKRVSCIGCRSPPSETPPPTQIIGNSECRYVHCNCEGLAATRYGFLHAWHAPLLFVRSVTMRRARWGCW